MNDRLKILEENAIKFIQTVERTAEKELYCANSGGKDSAIVEHLLKLSGIKYISMHSITTIDPPGTLKYIRENYPHTILLKPQYSFFKLIEKYGPPTRLRRFCCKFLKEYSSKGKMVFEGIRSAESNKRKNRDYIQCDTRSWMKGTQHIYPIYDWTDKDVWSYIEAKNIKLAPHYERGFKRLGCVGCPLMSLKKRQIELETYPKIYNAIKRSMVIGMNNNPQWKLSQCAKGDGDIAMQWWMSGKTLGQYFNVYPYKK